MEGFAPGHLLSGSTLAREAGTARVPAASCQTDGHFPPSRSRLRLKGHPLRLALDALEAALGHRLGHPLLPREAGRRSLGPLATCALALRPSPAPSPLQPPEEHLLGICAVGTSTRDAVVAALSEACPPKASWHWADEASGRLVCGSLCVATLSRGDAVSGKLLLKRDSLLLVTFK